MTSETPRSGRGLVVTAVGATVGAGTGCLLGYFPAMWVLEMTQCMKKGFVCGERFVAVALASGWLGTVLGGVLALRMARQDHLAWTALTLGVFIGLGMTTWFLIFHEYWVGGIVGGLLFLVAPVFLPVLAMVARAIALRRAPSGARS